MSQIVLYGIIISLILGIASFVASNNWIISVVILVIGTLYFILLANPMVKKYKTKKERFSECYHFVNTFIVSLSIKGTITGAYESAISSMPDDFITNIENIETFSNKEKLEHLHKYFRFHVFSLFLDLVNIYEEQGGDILEMSNHLLDETRCIEEYVTNSSSISKKKLMEFGVLWFLTIGIMVFLRFSLSQFFKTLTKQLFYPIGILGVSLFCLLTIHIAIYRMCKLQIKGWDDHEKI